MPDGRVGKESLAHDAIKVIVVEERAFYLLPMITVVTAHIISVIYNVTPKDLSLLYVNESLVSTT